ncbi:MAG TPA: hypothetical protein VH501_01155 [Solirubrobacterales bacterium]|jgi:hypothetical protein
MRRRALAIPALVAIGALTIAITAGPALSASGGHAEVAKKKKCKKKGKKRSADAAKKCKKKKKKKKAAPVVRATLNWSNGGSNDVDMDLFVFAAGGQQAGNGADTIPSSTLSPDLTGPAGSETFTDLAFNQRRPLSFGVCYRVSGSVHTDYTLTFITADGATHTETRADDGTPPSLGSEAHVNYSGGVPIPDNYCPGTNLVP